MATEIEDECDFCGMEAAVELCRGEECKTLLQTNFPMLCTNCSATLHKRYLHHRRFFEAPAIAPQLRELEGGSAITIATPSGGVRQDPLSANVPPSHIGAHEWRGEGDRASTSRSFQEQPRALENVAGHARPAAGVHSHECEGYWEGGPSGPSIPADHRSVISSTRTLEPGPCPGDYPGPSRRFCSQSAFYEVRAVRSSRTKLQPVHNRYHILLEHLKANPGHSLLDAYNSTGIPRSTVLGTKAIAELQLVDSRVFADVVRKSGGRVKIGRLNKLCSEVLSQPDLAKMAAEMRLRGDLLPFLTMTNRQGNAATTDRDQDQEEGAIC